MNYYKYNVGDYRRDTTHLSLLEHGIYRQMIDQYYLDEKPLNADKERLMRSLCVRTADEMRAAENVLLDFFELTENGYVHRRCERELQAVYAKSEKARQSAKNRWCDKKQEVTPSDDANGMRTHSERNADGMLPTTHNPLPTTHLKEKPEKKPVSQKIKKLDDADLELAGLMFSKISEVAPKTKPPNVEAWANTIRLMRKQDKLSLDEIQAVFVWANKHQFWAVNILSPDKLRKQFSKLHAQMVNQGKNNGSTNSQDRKPSLAERATEHRKRTERIWSEREKNEQSVGTDGAHIRVPVDVGFR